MLDGLVEPLAVHLHPLVAKQHQVVAARAQRLELLRRQQDVSQGHLHLEVQHRIGAHPCRRLTADRHRDPWPWPFAPPVGYPYRQAAPLQLRHALQKATGMRRRPGTQTAAPPALKSAPRQSVRKASRTGARAHSAADSSAPGSDSQRRCPAGVSRTPMDADCARKRERSASARASAIVEEVSTTTIDDRREVYSDLAIPPGETLADEIASRGMSRTELAALLGRPEHAVDEIVQGTKAITSDTALRLEQALGIPAAFWVNLEQNYRTTLTRSSGAV